MKLGRSELHRAARLSVAPMMDWTDRHCRYLHRLLSRQTLLYTEMVTAPALVRGGAVHLLDFSPEEHPVALQLGGSDPEELAQAARLGEEAGYDEINLNCGCPSDRVQSGTFGAVLMTRPSLVAECCAAMIEAVGLGIGSPAIAELYGWSESHPVVTCQDGRLVAIQCRSKDDAVSRIDSSACECLFATSIDGLGGG